MINYTKYDVAFLLIILCFFLPFISMPVYVDDIARYAYGYIGLASQGRFLTELYYLLFNYSGMVISPDMYQFNLIISVIALFFSVKYFMDSIQLTQGIHRTVASGLLICSTFFIENLSYHIDSIGMCLSLSLTLLSTIKFKSKYSIIYQCALLIAASFFYQTSFSLFVILTIMKCYIDAFRGISSKGIIRSILYSLLIFTVSVVFVQVVTGLFSGDSYIDSHAKLVGINSSSIEEVQNNIEKTYNLISSLSKGQLSLLVFISAISFIISIYHSYNMVMQRKLIPATLIALSLPIAFAFVFLPHILFNNAVIAPRVLISFSAFTLLVFIPTILSGSSIVKNIGFFAGTAYLLMVIPQSSIYVNATNYMYKYNSRIVESSIMRINALNKNDGPLKVIYLNDPTPPRYLQQLKKDFPIFNNLLRFGFTSKWFMNSLFRYNGIYAEAVSDKPEGSVNIAKYHDMDIYSAQDVYIVRFN